MIREDAKNHHEDKSDLFDFCCAMVSPGAVYDWWEGVPLTSLPNGGAMPNSREQAEEFMRHTRGLAVEMGLWPAL